tara:strand:- start:979 stop:2037 length:1059 start_codon:yes stop_codon:yes gene_type:complete
MYASIEKEKKEDITNKYMSKGLTGLVNLGNTCFINSTLQCLSHTYELNNFLSKEEYKYYLNRCPDTLVLWEWDNLRKLIWSENCTIKPAGFLTAIQRIARAKQQVLFTGFSQNDLTEFLHFIIDCFHNSIKREVNMTITGKIKNKQDLIAKTSYEMMEKMYEKEYSEIIKIFYGINISTIKSLESEYENITSEPFFNLTLEITKSNNLLDCIEKYTEIETLCDKIEVNENTKKKENCTKAIKFWNLPDILVITLKRFENERKKIQKMIDFPLTNLDLRKYVLGYDKKNSVYDLYGICNHMGGTRGGHYTAYVKNANNNWYLYNDTVVNEIQNLNKLKSPYAYCLFYRKKKIT